MSRGVCYEAGATYSHEIGYVNKVSDAAVFLEYHAARLRYSI